MVILGSGKTCDSYKNLSAAQVKKIFTSSKYRDKKWDGEKLTMISCYATGGRIMTAADLSGTLEDQPHDPETKKKLSGLDPGILRWIRRKQYQPINETKMKITHSRLRQIIKEEVNRIGESTDVPDADQDGRSDKEELEAIAANLPDDGDLYTDGSRATSATRDIVHARLGQIYEEDVSKAELDAWLDEAGDGWTLVEPGIEFSGWWGTDVIDEESWYVDGPEEELAAAEFMAEGTPVDEMPASWQQILRDVV